ncbi:MAG TPA: cytochrome P450 [Streptosporangiaceae bacterium]|nr:cytochrome P450 [Streptosporangiaceae bacterium]
MNDAATPADSVKTEVERLFKVLTSDEGRVDPYPVYAALRDLAPVYVDESTALLTRYDDCQVVVRTPTLGAQSPAWMDRVRPGWREHPGLVATHEAFIFRDPPDHTRLRRHVSGDFTPNRVRRWQDYIRLVTGEVLDVIADAGASGGTVDLHEVLATTMPIRIIGRIVGVPEQDFASLRVPLEGLRLAADGSPRSMLPVIDKAGEDLLSYFADLSSARRKEPKDDLISTLVQLRDADPDDAVLSEEEMLQTLALVFSAAIESMADFLLNGTAAFISFPEQAAALRGDPGLTPTAVEEAMRFDSPAQVACRIAAGGFSLAGVPIPDGTYIMAFIGAGNRDPERFPEPDSFDITRSGPAVLSLGGGAHFCLGANLARLEGSIFFPALVARFPKIQFAGTPVHRGFALRGYESFPVTIQ